MTPFTYARATDAAHAIGLASAGMQPRYLGGGTNLVDLMRETVERPQTLVDVSGLSRDIALRDDRSLMIGAAATNTALAADQAVREHYPLLSRAILAGASGQIRNMATVGGNILQRTRCTYFYDTASRCNKRVPQAGCDALEGHNRIHAILGAPLVGLPSCVATHPSDMCVALAALGAIIHLQSPDGMRLMPLVDLHRLPEGRPELDTVLSAHELITAVELPDSFTGARAAYRKIRDRSSYAFALVSVAALLEVRDGIVTKIRLALGGVAHKPWRAWRAEASLRGQRSSPAAFAHAAEAELANAMPLRDNGFKIELARRAIIATLTGLAEDPA